MHGSRDYTANEGTRSVPGAFSEAVAAKVAVSDRVGIAIARRLDSGSRRRMAEKRAEGETRV